MNTKKRTVLFILCSLLILQFTILSVGAEAISPRYTDISAIGASFSTNSAQTELTFSAYLRAYDLVPVTLKCSIQYKVNGYWYTEHSWEVNDTKNASIATTYKVDTYYPYRLLVRGYVYTTSGTLSESDTIYRYTS